MVRRNFGIREGIRIEPDMLFRLSKYYEYDFSLCDLGILYILNRYTDDKDDNILHQNGVTYYWVSILSMVEWFEQHSCYKEADIRNSILRLIQRGLIVTPSNFSFSLTDSGVWVFETDEMFKLLDPLGYASAKSYDLYYELYCKDAIPFKKSIQRGPEGWVYCFYNDVTGLSKIGITSNLTERTYSLECSSGIPLHFILAVKCSDYRKCERKLHAKFADFRQSGEWFLLDEPTRSNMKQCFEEIIVQNDYVVSEWKESV